MVSLVPFQPWVWHSREASPWHFLYRTGSNLGAGVTTVTKQLRQARGGTTAAHSLPVSGDEVLQLQQAELTLLHHLLSVEVLHQAGEDPTHTHTHTQLGSPHPTHTLSSHTHMGSPLRMCLQAVWMTGSQASLRARSMR